MEIADAELIRLGRELATWQAAAHALDAVLALPSSNPESEAALEAASDAVSAGGGEIVERILDLEATTLQGLLVKASAAAWCHGGRNFSPDAGTTDEKLSRSIVQNLLRMRDQVSVPVTV